MRRTAALTLALVALTACGGDSTPLPPITVGPEWYPLMLDTTGNFVMRRMGLWVDTAHVSALPGGTVRTAQRMLMDMKIGGVSTTMRMQTEVDCGGRRYRVTGMDSLQATVQGKPLSEADAQKAVAGQAQQAQDTTWKPVPDGDAGMGTALKAICAKGAAPAAAAKP